MKVREMRRNIAQAIAEGDIKQVGTPPSAIAGTIAMLNKEQCENIIDDSQIHWDDLSDAIGKRQAYMHQRRVNSGNADGNAEPTKPTEERKDFGNPKLKPTDLEEKMEQINQNQQGGDIQLPKGNDDEQFVTTKGVKSVEEVQEMVGAKQLTENIKCLSSHLTKDLRFLLDEKIIQGKQIEKLAKKIDENVGGEINIVSHTPKNITLKKEHYHPQFKNIVQMLPIAKQVMLVGDAGTGKTFVANQVADALGLQFKHISCSGGMSEGMLIGKMIFDGSFVSTDFLECYENGGVFLLDEMDSADANLLVVLNSALANGYLSVPNRKDNPTAKRHEDFLLLACCNTFGTGNGSRIYAGRNRLDGATLDRFYTIDFDYDKKLEFKLAGSQKWMMKAVHHLRKEVKRQRLDKVVSTRWIQQGQMTLDNTKKTLEEFLTEKTLSWTDAEKRKVDFDGIIDSFKGLSSDSKGAK